MKKLHNTAEYPFLFDFNIYVCTLKISYLPSQRGMSTWSIFAQNVYKWQSHTA